MHTQGAGPAGLSWVFTSIVKTNLRPGRSVCAHQLCFLVPLRLSVTISLRPLFFQRPHPPPFSSLQIQKTTTINHNNNSHLQHSVPQPPSLSPPFPPSVPPHHGGVEKGSPPRTDVRRHLPQAHGASVGALASPHMRVTGCQRKGGP